MKGPENLWMLCRGATEDRLFMRNFFIANSFIQQLGRAPVVKLLEFTVQFQLVEWPV